MKLDDKDHRILALLARDGRLTNRQLARAIGLSPSTCHDRVKRLEASGAILGYRAIISLEAPSERFEGWAVVRFIDSSADTRSRFVELVQESPAIVEAHKIAGPYDYAVRFLTADRTAWHDFERRVEALDCQIQTRLGVLLETLK